MPAYHAAQGVVGVGRPAPARHGGGDEPVQGVMGEDRQAASGSLIRSLGVVDGVPQASVGVVPVGGGHALLVYDGPEGVPQSVVVGPVSVGGAHGGGVGVSRGDDAGYAQEGVVGVGGPGDAAARVGVGQGAVGIGGRPMRRAEQFCWLARAVVIRLGDDVACAGSCPRLYVARQAVEGGGQRLGDEREFN